MKTFVAMSSAVVAICALAPNALASFKEGDRVLALRAGTNAYFAATVKSVPPPASMDGGSVTFDDGKLQQYGPITFEPSLKPFDWKVNSQIECAADATTAVEAGEGESPKLTLGKIVAIDDKTVELEAAATKARTKFPLAGCRHRRTWWDEVSDRWRNYASYKTLKAMPKKGAKAPSSNEVQSSFDFYLQSADGGGYIVIKKCQTIGKSWQKITSGGVLVARVVDVACGMSIPLPPKPRENFTCLVEYGQCRQEHQGKNVYGGCVWNNVRRDPDQIACKSIK